MVNILFLLLAFLSELVGTIGGFGSSVFFVPLAGFFFDFQTVLAITAVLHVFSNLAKLILFHKGISWRLLLLIGLPSVIFVIIGAWLSTLLYSKFTELFLGIFLVFFGALFMRYPDLKISQSKTNAIAGGTAAGFLAGLIGTGGAIRGLSLAAFDLEMNAFIATSAAIDFGVDFSRTAVYLKNGYLQPTYYIYIPFMLGVAFLGSYLGKLALNKVSQTNFKKIVVAFIMLIGITMIAKVIFN
jgi:uncharacterized protein